MKKTLIFGHKKPDTDSVASCIALSYLHKQLNDNCEARVLGDINKETKYALNYFNIKKPEYLNDVKLQLKDIKYHKGFFAKTTDSIFDCYNKMLSEDLTGLPIANLDNSFYGLLTLKDLSYSIINENIIDLNTSYDNLLAALKAESILKYDDEITGKIIVASYRSTTFLNNVDLSKDSVLVVGDRHSIIEYGVNSKVKIIIITGNGEIKDKHIEIAKENKVNIIKSPYNTYHIARLLTLANYITTMSANEDPITFEENAYVDDVLDINNKLKHTNYPIVNKSNKCLGLLKITDLNDKNPKNVILVDHNEKGQSADGIDEANILEIIDHHNLGSITTKTPINFRNMAVGSTNTIIYNLFKEKDITIPKNIAGIMLSGILSDTLILKSPTKTEKDVEAVDELSLISGVDYQKYGLELLKAGTSLTGMTKENVLYNDFKVYTVKDKSFAIGQFFTMNFSDISKDLEEYVKVLNEVVEANKYELVLLYITDIIKNGSYILYNSKAKNDLEVIYELKDISEGFFIEGCVSRKKHVVPLLMDLFEN